jgi:hypothetical protein
MEEMQFLILSLPLSRKESPRATGKPGPGEVKLTAKHFPDQAESAAPVPGAPLPEAPPPACNELSDP